MLLELMDRDFSIAKIEQVGCQVLRLPVRIVAIEEYLSDIK
jgi:hypothetical protein